MLRNYFFLKSDSKIKTEKISSFFLIIFAKLSIRRLKGSNSSPPWKALGRLSENVANKQEGKTKENSLEIHWKFIGAVP